VALVALSGCAGEQKVPQCPPTAPAASASASAAPANAPAPAAVAGTDVSKPASDATKRYNAAVQAYLNFGDKQDFEDAKRGLIGRPEKLTITDDKGKVVWDLEAYKAFIADNKAAPDTVNPSLWRNAQLNMQYGLFKVTEGVYQVRGYDLSNITFVQGKTGWIVGDPLISKETAKAAYDLVTQHLGKKPVVAVVYSHSHVDHYGGVRGLVGDADVKSGKVKILAPEDFTEHAVAENVIAGNAMARRATYMYGALLPKNATGGVNGGLGQTTSTGDAGLIPPTDIIKKTGEKRTIDGVEMVFQMTPGTEAPAEMNVFFPKLKAMWMAENATHTFHNVLTLRGAVVRDPLIWAKFMNETIDTYGPQIEAEFASHHWPMWGNARILEFLGKQRDLYKYVHDQSVNLLNKGYTGTEIAEMIKLPPELDKAWFNRGYYGTLKHNSRAIYQRYMGFYDSNPTTLDQLPPEAAAKKYVEYMGGANAIVQKAKGDFDRGEYRWVAEALKHVVFADPSNKAAKDLLADAYEQMGYQAESGPWRAEYLQGAAELRSGTPTAGGVVTASPDTIRAMTPELVFNYWGVKLNGQKAAGKKLNLVFSFTDLNKKYAVTLENSVLNASEKLTGTADATVTLSKPDLDAIALGSSPQEQIKNGKWKVTGKAEAVTQLFGLLDDFPFWFNIVTP
jgi:alkyl sulfatase BDS1-like metallo-beta-lactamase superfamily hydrolase